MTNKQLDSEMILKQLEALAQEFVCCACKQQNRKPVTVTKCGHHFCHSCITKVIAEGNNSSVCPQCDNKINLKSLSTNKCVNQLFLHFESLLKACSDELKLSVQLPPIMKTPNFKGKQTPVAVTKQQVQPTKSLHHRRTLSRSKSPTETKQIVADKKEPEVKIKPPQEIIKQRKETTAGTSKQQVQSSESKRRGRNSITPSECKEKFCTKAKEMQGEVKSTLDILRRGTPRRASAIKASNTIPAMLRSEESTPDTPQLDIPVSVKPSDNQTKVSTWLKDAPTSCIPTQDRPVITTTPITQSTLVSVSQSHKLPIPPVITIPDDCQISERIVEDPYEFISSQPDSIAKRPKIKSKPVAQKKNLTSGKKVATRRKTKADDEIIGISDMLLFKSQSEQHIAEKEEKRLKELERPIYMQTEIPISKQRGKRVKSLSSRQLKTQKLANDSEEDEPIFVRNGQPVRKYGKLKRKFSWDEDEDTIKMQKKINEAEKHSLVIAKKKCTDESKLISPVESRECKTRSLSIAIDSPTTSVSPQQQISVAPKESKVLEKTALKQSKLVGIPSPGFSRLKKMKSDFKSPVRNKVVPLDVSTTSIAHKDTESAMDLEASITEIPSSKSNHKSVRFDATTTTTAQQAETSKLQESFNSTVSSLGAPDLERGIELMKAVERIEHEIENNIITDSDVESNLPDTQQSTTLIENSVPLETETKSLFKHIPKARIIEQTQEAPVQMEEEKEEETIVVDKQVSPLKELSNKIDSQRDTQMSQSIVNLLEQIHDVPKRKTFSLELNTGDIMTDVPSRESTQQQLVSLTQPKSQQSVTSTPRGVPEEPPVLRVRFVKQGKLHPCVPYYQVPFYKLGYLSPNLQNKGLKYQPLHRCSCGGVTYSAHVKTTTSSTNTSQPNKVSQHSVQAQTTQSLVSEISKPTTSTSTNTSQPSQSSVEAQTTPSLLPQESKEIQTSPQLATSISESRITDSATDSNMTNNLNIARFMSSQQEMSDCIKKNAKSLKTSTQKFVYSQEPLFSSDSLPSSVSQDPCVPKIVAELKTPEKVKNPLENNEEPIEIEDDEEITVIEKTQEEKPRSLFSTLGKIGKLPLKSKVPENMELSQALTINSDDILPATLSQPPQKSALFAFNKDESPSKMSKTSTPMSRNESDYNDEDEVQVSKSASRLRKRGRPLVISSDSESEQEVKQPAKRPVRLSMRKSILNDVKETWATSTDSDAPIRAQVKADLAYARAVAAEQVSSTDESVVMVTLDSTPMNSAPPTPHIEEEPQKSEEKDKLKVAAVISPENNKMISSKVFESPHAGSLLEENTAAIERNNPFFDTNVLHDSIETTYTELVNKFVEPAKKLKSPASVPKPPENKQIDISITRNKQSVPVVEESDSDSDTIFESTPSKKPAEVKKTSTTPRVNRSVIPKAATKVTPVMNPKVTSKVATSPRQISIIWSSLDEDSVKLVNKFLQRFKQVKHSSAFVPITTHVVVPYEENSKCTFSTLKYLLAVASGGWVVSINWIKDCLLADKIIPEEPYEIGPKASRNESEKLFRDFEIYCADGAYDHVPKKNLREIITYAGGKVIISFDQLKTPCTRKYRLVVAPTEDIPAELQDCEYPIILLDWVVESVEQYRLSAVVSHLARTIDELIISKMKLPKEMLEVPEDESTSYTSTNFTNNTLFTQT